MCDAQRGRHAVRYCTSTSAHAASSHRHDSAHRVSDGWGLSEKDAPLPRTGCGSSWRQWHFATTNVVAFTQLTRLAWLSSNNNSGEQTTPWSEIYLQWFVLSTLVDAITNRKIVLIRITSYYLSVPLSLYKDSACYPRDKRWMFRNIADSQYGLRRPCWFTLKASRRFFKQRRCGRRCRCRQLPNFRCFTVALF